MDSEEYRLAHQIEMLEKRQVKMKLLAENLALDLKKKRALQARLNSLCPYEPPCNFCWTAGTGTHWEEDCLKAGEAGAHSG